jgi:hypothetical protein
VDWIQFPFEIDTHLHNGPDAPVVRVRWTFTNLPWLHVEGGILMNNRIWNEDQTSDLPVGQLPLVESNYVQDSRWVLPPGLTGKHVCHREWFSTGEPWPNNLPPTKYDDQWIPDCCIREAEGAQGGVEIGGACGDKFTGGVATYGGVEVGGSAGDVVYLADAAAGGVEVGGSAGDVVHLADAAAGGVEVGGEAGDVWGWVDAAAGGVEVGGSAGDVFAFQDPAAGGIEIGGSAGDVVHLADAAAGGVEVGGEAGDVWGWVDATEGGVEVGGSAGDVFTPGGDPAKGGVEVGGSAGDVFDSGHPYCDTYLIDGTVIVTRNPDPDFLTWENEDGTYILGADSAISPAAWNLSVAGFPFATWLSGTTWDGVGSRTFNRVGFGGPDTRTVECDD